MFHRTGRVRTLSALVFVGITCGGLATAGGTAVAAGAVTVTCPTVSALGVVTPAPAPGVDWAGCSLYGADLSGADLSGADLTSATLTDARLTGADLTGATLTSATLQDTGFTSATLTNANLSNAFLLDASFAGATLTGTNLAGATLAYVESGQVTASPTDPPTLPADWTLLDGYLAGPQATLVGANLAGQDLSGLDLAGANLKEADLAGANLSGTDLTSADLNFVTSGTVTGSPAPKLPTNWTLQGGYLLGPYTNLAGVDLTSLNLAGLDLLGADLSDANLAGLDLSGTRIQGANLAGANINGTQLAGADVLGTRFGAINGTPASLPTGYVIVTVPASSTTPGNYLAGPDAYLYELDFSGLDLSNVDLAGAYLYGANLSGTTLDGADLVNVTLNDANLTGASLDGADLASSFVRDANLTGANLTSVNATEADFGDDNLTRVNLSQTNLTEANLGGVTSSGITGTPADLPVYAGLVRGYLLVAGAVLHGADLSGANLQNLDIGNANLTDATLSNADLAGTTLNYADLAGANLAGADLTDAVLIGTDLTGANATSANFTGAAFSDTTVSGLAMSGADFTGASIAAPPGPSVAREGLVYTSPGTGTPSALPADYAAVDGYLVGPYDSIQGASLTGANLSKDDLANSYITSSDLTSANLDGANLTSTDLQGDTVTGATAAGAFWLNTTCPGGSNSNKYVDGCFSSLDTTPPVVTITGVPVPNRGVYVLGHVPTPGCKTTDDGTVTSPASLTIKTVAARGAGPGVGRITATCSGAVDLAGNAAAPVSVSYTNVYGTTGFLSLANGATFARTTRVITVRFRLTDSTGKAIPASTAEAFAAAHNVHITMAGPGTRATTNTCAWIAAQQYLACAIHVPAGVKAGSSQRYTITATENVSTAFQNIPGVHGAANPEVIHFR
jgi:uncharacterized protein YjbI with pentapeptide repeats